MAFDRFSVERDMQSETHDTGVRSVPSSRAARNGYGAFEHGSSAGAQRVRKLVEQSAASDLPVLITGEVGVGKDLVAREIHRRSARSRVPLLEINCAALADDDELFDGDLPHEGTLFLNGIGELSPALQQQLFELLRCGESNGAGPAHGVRAIAATHRDLAHAVETGSFNEDLYYCLNLIHIHVPPLRSRLEDVPALLQYFLHEHAQQDGGREQRVPESIRSRMTGYEWPGNLRELENTIRSFVALNDPEYVIAELDARASERERSTRPPGAHAFASGHPPAGVLLEHDGYRIDLKKLGREASDAAEKDAIVNMLAHTMGNKKAAARRLGISYKAMLYKIRDYGIADGHAVDDHVDVECGKAHTVTPEV